MDEVATAERYFAAWNDHDTAAIAAVFSEGGTYTDPTCPAGLSADGAAEYAGRLIDAFPDLAFEVGSQATGPEGLVIAAWCMTGTNRGSFMGLPPTGRAVSVRGVDVIVAEGGRVRSVEGFFDARAIPEQLGLQVIVQPNAVGPFQFGVSRYVAAADSEPGAVSLTVLEARSAEEIGEVADRSRQIVQELLEAPGFISWLGVLVGSRMYTITAWRTPDDVAALRESPAHAEAMALFFGSELARGGQTGVWSPHRLNGMWARCDACGTMSPASGGPCACGAEVTPPRYW